MANNKNRMPTCAAFLRGLNVGGHRVSMESLRSLLSAAGLNNVSTIIASGNVLFDNGGAKSPALEKKIETVLKNGLGYDVATFVRSMDEIKQVAESASAAEAKRLGWNLHITFLKTPATAAMASAFAALETPDDLFRIVGREIYWIRNGRMTDSVVKEKHLKGALSRQSNTVRNHNTILRIVEKFG